MDRRDNESDTKPATQTGGDSIIPLVVVTETTEQLPPSKTSTDLEQKIEGNVETNDTAPSEKVISPTLEQQDKPIIITNTIAAATSPSDVDTTALSKDSSLMGTSDVPADQPAGCGKTIPLDHKASATATEEPKISLSSITEEPVSSVTEKPKISDTEERKNSSDVLDIQLGALLDILHSGIK